jgi:hypothetical protein
LSSAWAWARRAGSFGKLVTPQAPTVIAGGVIEASARSDGLLDVVDPCGGRPEQRPLEPLPHLRRRLALSLLDRLDHAGGATGGYAFRRGYPRIFFAV